MGDVATKDAPKVAIGVAYENIATWRSGASEEVQVRVSFSREAEGPDASFHQQLLTAVCEQENIRRATYAEPMAICKMLLGALTGVNTIEVRTMSGASAIYVTG